MVLIAIYWIVESFVGKIGLKAQRDYPIKILKHLTVDTLPGRCLSLNNINAITADYHEGSFGIMCNVCGV